jgi:hypothetical protein
VSPHSQSASKALEEDEHEHCQFYILLFRVKKKKTSHNGSYFLASMGTHGKGSNAVGDEDVGMVVVHEERSA